MIIELHFDQSVLMRKKSGTFHGEQYKRTGFQRVCILSGGLKNKGEAELIVWRAVKRSGHRMADVEAPDAVRRGLELNNKISTPGGKDPGT